jgi:uncharacterized damage-inducible protein DinB
MTEVARILDQILRAWDGDAWHGPPVRRVLEGVTAAAADGRPVPGAHTIAELVFHMAFCKDEARRRLGGELLLSKDEEAWPPAGTAGEAAWQQSVARLGQAQREFVDAVAALTDDQLETPIAGKDYNAYVLLHGVVQHDLYHAGQIALLKKLVP